MNREIKFRAWDEEAKRMNYSRTEQFDDMLGFRFDHFATNEPIYMQYTGLHDKNGKEIYEGDITNPISDGFGTKSYEIVMDLFFGLRLRNCRGLERSPIPFLHDLEVVGNIYETPALLEAATC